MDSSTHLLEFRTYQTQRGLEAYADVPTLDVQLGGLPGWLDANAAYIEVVAPTGEALVLKSRKGPPLGRIPQSREPADRAGCQYLRRIIQEEDGKRLAVKGEADAMEKLRSVMLVALPLLPGLHDALGRVLDACECRADALCRSCALISAMLSANPRVTLSSFPAPTSFTPRTEAELEVVEFRARTAGDEDVLALVAEVRAARTVPSPAEVERARAAVASALEAANIGWADEHLAHLAGVASMAVALAQQVEELQSLEARRATAEPHRPHLHGMGEWDMPPEVDDMSAEEAECVDPPTPLSEPGSDGPDAPAPMVECPPCSKAGGADRAVFHEAPPCSSPEARTASRLQPLVLATEVVATETPGEFVVTVTGPVRAPDTRGLDAAPPSRLIPLPLPSTPPLAPTPVSCDWCGCTDCGGQCQG